MRIHNIVIAATLAAAASTSALAAPSLPTEWKGSDGSSFKISGLVMLDAFSQQAERVAPLGDVDLSGTRLRLARVGVEGSFTPKWAYRAEFSAKESQTQWDDLWLEYRPSKTTGVRVGHFKPLGLEQTTSERYMTFLERGAYADVTDTGRMMSVAVRANGDRWTVTALAHGDDINNADVNGQERFGLAARATFAPVVTDTTRVHVGVWARSRDAGDGPGLAYRARPNTAWGSRYIDAGAIGETDTTLAGEAALVAGPFSLQAEAATMDIEGPAGDGEAKTAYAYGSWFVTGESRNYEPSKGTFGAVKPRVSVEDGGPGAIELAVRYEVADLSDLPAAPLRGEQRAWTAGVNWAPVANVRFLVNYTDAEADTVIAANRSDVQVVQARAQFFF